MMENIFEYIREQLYLEENRLETKIKKTVGTLRHYQNVKRNCRKTEKTPDDIRGCIETSDEYIRMYKKELIKLRQKVK